MLLGQANLRKALGAGFAAILVSSVALGQAGPSLSATEVVCRMLRSEQEQEKNLQHYRMVREYRLNNEDGSKAVKLVANVSYDGAAAKSIEVVQESGSEGIFRKVLKKVVETEVRASREEGRREMRLSPENYNFKLLGSEDRDGRPAYVLQLLPKRKSKFLIDGRLWVDAQEFAIVRVEGRPAASLSFWVGKPDITQSFQKVGDVWLMSRNESLTRAKLIGKVTFVMETREVQNAASKIALVAPAGHGDSLSKGAGFTRRGNP